MSYFSEANYDHVWKCWHKSYDWKAHTLRNLEWRHGPDLAYRIHSGRDPSTIADLARWNSLGRKGDQAA